MTLEEAKDFFSKDNYAVSTSGIEILEPGLGHSKVMVKIDERHKNAVGYVMGGLYFTIADFAFAVATNDKEHTTVTTTSTISYFKPCLTETMCCEANLIKDGRTTCFYRMDVTDADGKLCASVNTCGNHVVKK